MNKKVKKEIIEWVVIIGVLGGLYISGLHTEVIGLLQRGVLATGIIQPDTNETGATADYDLLLKDPNGNTINLNEWKGEPIFLNFWATWCPPCIAEMPDIDNLYKNVGDEVNFALISLDENPEKAIEFIERKGFDTPIYFLASSVPEAFQSRSIPTTFVISPDGRIVVSNKGMAKYNTDDFRKFLMNL